MKGYPSGTGKCAKQEVIATLVAVGGETFVGTNYCNNPQHSCPREERGMKSGEGYYLCKEICNQPHHAEVNAIISAGSKAKGSTIYLQGHSYACNDCTKQAKDAGVANIHLLGAL